MGCTIRSRILKGLQRITIKVTLCVQLFLLVSDTTGCFMVTGTRLECFPRKGDQAHLAVKCPIRMPFPDNRLPLMKLYSFIITVLKAPSYCEAGPRSHFSARSTRIDCQRGVRLKCSY
ncbi:hypothetical protein F5141DRAFT_209666 [Pisolithus sp. B1]|nr:hypothetical protein F5141DRAFT_209666 [Pisolithus sp. B1]